METQKERLREFIKHKKLSDQAFIRSIGATKTYLSSMVNKVGDKYLETILSVYPELNRDWLLYGEGEMIEKNTVRYPVRPEVVLTDPTDFTLVPLVNIDSVGGMKSNNDLVSSEQFIERMIPFTEAREGDIAIHQSGDSMSPGIPAGSILLIRNVENWREYFGYGNVFVLWLKDDRRLTKRVDKYSADPTKYVVCHSFNPEYADEELPKSFIREVWKVIKVLNDKGW